MSPLVLAPGATLTDADGNDAVLAIPAAASLADSSNFVIAAIAADRGGSTDRAGVG